jgi:hypothetical protein
MAEQLMVRAVTHLETPVLVAAAPGGMVLVAVAGALELLLFATLTLVASVQQVAL